MVSQFRTSCIAYASSKAALIGLTRVAALELGAYGITVNAIGPGPIETELFKQANSKGAPETEQILKNVPVQRFGQPEDIAHACDFFSVKNQDLLRGKFYMSVGA
jgi:NAD(P)-dependent dehydrogenase (short-subunit alcohol dehydrogenase family)